MKNFKSGLKPLKQKTIFEILKGKVDYSHSKTFGSVPLEVLPKDYFLKSKILNQGATMECTAYSACSIQESQEEKEFDTDWFYNAEGIVKGRHSKTGYDLRTVMKTGIKKGFMPIGGKEIDAVKYKEGGYFSVDGSFDLFDNIRMAIYMARDEKKTCESGLMWFQEFSNSEYGIITGRYSKEIGLHAVKIAGWTRTKQDGTLLPYLPNDDPYLLIQNSYGEGYGDNGFFYFPREIVNKEFKIGTYLWRSQEEVIKTMSIFVALLHKVVDLYKQLIEFHKPKETPKIEDIDEEVTKVLLWDKDNARHSCRVIMDEYGLSWGEKDLLCAVIQSESNFYINAKNVNRDKSTDWGICQINDYWWIGEGKYFKSVKEVLEKPELSVRFMIKQYKSGHLDYWYGYRDGNYQKYL